VHGERHLGQLRNLHELDVQQRGVLGHVRARTAPVQRSAAPGLRRRRHLAEPRQRLHVQPDVQFQHGDVHRPVYALRTGIGDRGELLRRVAADREERLPCPVRGTRRTGCCLP
jgi:hypothetical protein